MKNNETAVVNDEAGKVEEVAETPEVVAEVEDEATEPAPAAPEKKPGAKAKVKEFFRKKIVALKRKPQNIAFFFLAVTSLFYLLSLNTVSPGPYGDFSETSWLGLCVFITTLFSILVLILFLNTFPKYPKVNKKTGKKRNINYVMLVLTFVFIAAMIVANIMYYVILTGEIADHEVNFFRTASQALRYKKYWGEDFSLSDGFVPREYKAYLLKSFDICIAHTVMLGISAILLATMPLYKKLILKINTSKEVASTEMKEAIDVED